MLILVPWRDLDDLDIPQFIIWAFLYWQYPTNWNRLGRSGKYVREFDAMQQHQSVRDKLQEDSEAH